MKAQKYFLGKNERLLIKWQWKIFNLEILLLLLLYTRITYA